MTGISSKAAGSLENKRSKYNGYELNTDFDLNLYESFYRTHDQQIGRFWQIDPKPTVDISLYSSMDNNPILHNDPLGDKIRYKGEDLDNAIRILEKKLGGMYKVKLTNVKDKYGFTKQATLVKTKSFDANKLTTEQKNFVSEYNRAETNSATVRQEFVTGRKCGLGDWESGKVDMNDISAMDKVKGGPTALSTYSHEVIEQLEKAKMGLLPNQDGTGKQFGDAHKEGIKSEDFVSGTKRDDKTQIFTEPSGQKIQVSIYYDMDGNAVIKKTKIN
jgi:RHS repeat-associated protein